MRKFTILILFASLFACSQTPSIESKTARNGAANVERDYHFVRNDTLFFYDAETGIIDVALADTTPLNRVSVNRLPVGNVELPTEFNNLANVEPFSDGSKIQFKTNPYDRLDTAWQDATHYYVNFTTGNNANTGLSSAAAYKTFDFMVANITYPAVVHLEDDFYGINGSNFIDKIFDGSVKLIGEGAYANTGRTLFSGMNENLSAANFAWTANGGAYVSTNGNAIQLRSQFDGNYVDDKGIPMPIKYVATQAECISTPGTFHWATGNTLTVHMIDGRIPDPYDGWISNRSPYDFEIQSSVSDATILLENIGFTSNLGTAKKAVFRYRPQTIAVNNVRLGLRNCTAFGGNSNGFQIYDAEISVFDNCHSKYCASDGFNYHSFITTGTKGEYMTVYENDCTGHFFGVVPFDNQPALGTSENASSCHDNIHILRTNSIMSDCNGAVVADVLGSVSVNLNVTAGNPTGTASPRACFWNDGALATGANDGMWLWGCSAYDDGDPTTLIFSNTTGGSLYIKNWLGQVNGSTIGEIKDFSGNVIQE